MKWHTILDKAIESKLIYYALVLLWLVWAVFNALNHAIDIPTMHLDGAFQTASGLYRIDSGQFPGRDFYPYLGIGPLYLMYPLYQIFGADLAASVATSYLITTTVAMLSVAFVFQLIWKPKSVLTSIAIGSVAISLCGLLLSMTHVHFLKWWFTPGNSLRPLRSFVPYLTAMFYYFFVARVVDIRLKYISAGVLTAAVLLWSNDFAITTALLLGSLILLHSWVKGECTIKNLTCYLAVSVLVWSSLIYLACHGHPVEMLRYNFQDAAQDQWWYFGFYGESSRIFTFYQVLKLPFLVEPLQGAIVFGVLAYLAIKYKSLEYALLMWLGVALFAGGIVASVGGHYEPGYFKAYKYWLSVVCLLGGIKLIAFYWHKKRFNLYCNKRVLVIMSAILLTTFFTLIGVSAYQYKQNLFVAKNDNQRFYISELGGYLSTDWRDYIQLARATPLNISVYEEYWGIWSALRHTFPNWPVDSIIHALGHTRDLATLNMKNADIIITTKRTSDKITMVWQPWNVSQNYWFYEPLLLGYAISSTSPKTIVWRKTNHQSLMTPIQCKPVYLVANMGLELAVTSSGYYEVEMEYKLHTHSRSLIMAQNNISWAGGFPRYISINPKSTTAKFPAYLNNAKQARLNIQVVGNGDAKLDITSCHARQIVFRNQAVLPIPPVIIKDEL
ncbi:MAG: hypothetical protein HOP21_09830 [Methylotenera sp.]|nr:hypothetical protein [Methylotenera sp.]